MITESDGKPNIYAKILQLCDINHVDNGTRNRGPERMNQQGPQITYGNKNYSEQYIVKIQQNEIRMSETLSEYCGIDDIFHPCVTVRSFRLAKGYSL